MLWDAPLPEWVSDMGTWRERGHGGEGMWPVGRAIQEKATAGNSCLELELTS